MRLECIDPGRNACRFYAITVEPDLFNEASVVVRWGRIGRPGRVRVHAGGDRGAMSRIADKLERSKLRKGYAPAPS